MTKDNQTKFFINKACQETYDKYGSNQLSEALKQYITNANPNYFTGKDNKQNIVKINPKDISKHIMYTLLEANEIKTNKGYARILSTSNPDGVLYADNVENILYNYMSTYGPEQTTEVINDSLANNEKFGHELINSFVHERYSNPSLTNQDYLEFEANNPNFSQEYNVNSSVAITNKGYK